jgi:hypothetical protein
MAQGDPANHAVAIAPSDTVDLTSPARSIYVGTTGNLTVVMYPSREVVSFLTVPVGVLPIQVARVNATGTSAANLVALW